MIVLKVLLIPLISYAVYYFYVIFTFERRFEISDDFCWGKDINCRNDTAIIPFEINVKNNEISDVLSRFNNTREFTPSLEGTQNQYGINGQVLHKFLNFIRNEYNFTESQNNLNQYPQFITNIQGLNIHFVHVKSENKKKLPVIPILLLHGWPSSVLEFYDSVPLFMAEKPNRMFVIDLVIPSLIGFGYSDGPAKPNCRAIHIANMMRILMNRLSYNKFVVHGSDWGAIVATNLATQYPESLIGFHSNFCISLRVISLFKLAFSALYRPVLNYAKFIVSESGYFHLMATKPDTIGHVLDDTPIGLITFMFDKFSVGRNKSLIHLPTAGFEEFDTKKLLDIILFYYWFPQKATTAARMYFENMQLKALFFEGLHNVPVDPTVPCACTLYENEFLYVTESVVRDKFQNLIQFNTFPGIGHFAAIESNEIFTNDIISFIEKLCNLTNRN